MMGSGKTIWIIDHYSSEPQYGGISRQFDFANELSRRGYNIVVIASTFSHFSHKYISEEEILINKIAENAHYVYLKTTSYYKNNGMGRMKSLFSFERAIVKNMAYIAEILGKPDVVNGCSVHPLAWVAAYRVSKKFQCRFCIEVRDLWPWIWVADGGKSIWHPLVIFFGLLEKWAYKHADRIIYSMIYGDKYICDRKKTPREKVILIGQPMDCVRFDLNAKNNRGMIPQELRTFLEGHFCCIFAGYYMKYEGVFAMLEAAKILKARGLPIRMAFVGSGMEKEKMEQIAIVQDLDNVYIGDRISKEAIPALLSMGDIYMAHLGIEGHEQAYQYGVSKNKVNEYMFGGGCTLYGFIYKNDAVAVSKAGFVFEPFNASELADKIQMVYELPLQERKQLGVNGRNYIRQHHSVEKLTDQLEAVFFR